MDKLKQIKASHLRIGLLGGTFDPPHRGHLFISKDALQRFNLDYVWWIVTKQNTLKTNEASDFNRRLALCNEILKQEKKIIVSDIESTIKSTDTIDVLNLIKDTYNNEYFWIMGSDGLLTFDQWPDWQEILSLVKVVAYDRPGFVYSDNESKINPELRNYRKDLAEFQQSKTLAWTLVGISTPDISSTKIRARKQA